MEKFNETENIDSVEELIANLAKTNCCRSILENLDVEGWIHSYITNFGCGYIPEESKEYILYSLTYILNELKRLPKEKMNKYLDDPDYLLEDVISISKEEKDWNFDKYSALAFCSQIVVDYVFEIEDDLSLIEYDDTIKYNDLYVDPNNESSALKQIIKNYSHKVFDEIYDPIWILYFDELMDKHDDDEGEVYMQHNISELKYLVRHRIILPECYKL